MLDLSGIPKESRWRPSDRVTNLWGTAIGAWGDTLCCYGEFLNYPREGGIFYYGYDKSIPRFLLAQQPVQEVIHVLPNSKEEYIEYVRGTASEEDFPLPFVLPLPKQQKIIPTHLRPSIATARVPKRWHGARLDGDAHFAAECILSEYAIGDNFILLQPYSTQSCAFEGHWQGWSDIIKTILVYTPYKYLLIGKDWEAVGSHPNIINLIGKVPDMLTVFALAERALGCVTTCNSLSLYAAVQGIPAIVAENKALNVAPFFFKRWIMGLENIHLIGMDDGWDVMLSAFCKVFRP